MKKILAGVLSAGMVIGLCACSSQPNSDTTTQTATNEQFDIVIVGAGGAGLSAAVEAKQNGADNILVLEKMGFAGGSTTMAFGGMSCTNSRFLDEAGIVESPIMLTDVIVELGGGYSDPDMAAVVAMESPSYIEWLDSMGSEWGKLRYGDLHCPTDGTIPGVELVRVLQEQCEKEGIEIRYNTPATELVADHTGRVVGVKVNGVEGEYTIDATAVILATGGFENNPEMMVEYGNPSLANIHVAPSQGNMGDGITMALPLGASLRNMELIQLSCAVAPFSIQMQLPIKNDGVVFVNKEGKRFTNEFSASSSDRRIVDDILNQTDAECYAVYSDAIYQDFMSIEEKDFFAEYRMSGIDNSGKVLKAETLEELAELMGVDVATFTDTMANLKTDGIGNDSVIARADTYKEGPYYALLVTPGVMDTLGGLEADTTARVLNTEGKPIKGLYAAGEVIGNTQGVYYTVGLGEAGVFGRVAARNAIEYVTNRGGLTEHVPFERGEANKEEAEAVKGNFTDGTYTGEGKGNNGAIKVEVVVKDGSIVEINVLEHVETPNIYEGALEQFIPSLIQTQNVDVDAVSGATNSCNGIREAVKAALGL